MIQKKRLKVVRYVLHGSYGKKDIPEIQELDGYKQNKMPKMQEKRNCKDYRGNAICIRINRIRHGEKPNLERSKRYTDHQDLVHMQRMWIQDQNNNQIRQGL